ncbi:MAG: PIN domain-containing protein [Deltaproteobacteria bacterium]|nr:PIN domain-containing protein [Deltaproteobacteria bacterium]
MSGFLLDTSALLALRDDETGAERVANILESAADGGIACHGCFISLMEVLYRVWKDEGEEAGRSAYRVCQRLPITWLHESTPLLERAAEIKARFPLSLADAWIAAAALELDAILVHKDPEFEKVSGLKQECLPCI